MPVRKIRSRETPLYVFEGKSTIQLGILNNVRRVIVFDEIEGRRLPEYEEIENYK